MKTTIWSYIFQIHRKNKAVYIGIPVLILMFLSSFTIGFCAFQDKVTRNVLDNGITCLAVENQKIDVVAICVYLKLGQRDEDDMTAGYVNLIKELFWKDSSVYENGYEYEFEKIGSMVKTSGNTDYIKLTVLTNKQSLPLVLEMISKKLQKFDPDDKEFEKTRNSTLKDINDPDNIFSMLYSSFKNSFYRYHPYKFPEKGFKKNIENVSKAKLSSFYYKNVIPSSIFISVAGNFEKKELAKLIKKNFDMFKYVEKKEFKIDWEPPNEESTLSYSININLSWVMLGYSAPSVKSPDYPAMRVISSYLSEGIASRMWVELREKRALAYDLGVLYPQQEGPSHIVFYSVSSADKVDDCRRQIFSIVNNLKRNSMTEAELQEIKSKIMGKYIVSQEERENISDETGVFEAYNLGYRYNWVLMQKIEHLTTEDIKRVADFYFNNYILITTQGAYGI